MIGGLVRFLLTRLVPLVVLAVAVFVGWLATFPLPEGTLFGMIYPISKGYVPTIFSGGFKVCPVNPLPDKDNGGLELDPRPAKEAFVTLPGFVASGEDASVDPSFLMPQQGIGMCCRYTAYDAESVRRTILWYLKVGGRHIDTADLYLNHEWIGQALQQGMQDYNIPREEIWVTTKLFPRFYGTNSTLEAIPRMLRELQLDYVDLMLMHAPNDIVAPFIGAKTECRTKGLTPKECRLETWKALTVARNEKQWVRHVGVSNFNVRQLQELQALGDSVAPIANNQFQYNPWMPEYTHETFAFCQKEGISVTAWSSFSGSAMQHMAAFSVETLQNIASHHETSVAQVLLKWAMQKGAIVIPGTGNPKHMKENLNAYNLELTPQEMAEIDELRKDKSARGFFAQPEDES